MNTCYREIFCNLIAIELKLYVPFRAGEAQILTKFDDCLIIRRKARTISARSFLSIVGGIISSTDDGNCVWLCVRMCASSSHLFSTIK